MFRETFRLKLIRQQHWNNNKGETQQISNNKSETQQISNNNKTTDKEETMKKETIQYDRGKEENNRRQDHDDGDEEEDENEGGRRRGRSDEGRRRRRRTTTTATTNDTNQPRPRPPRRRRDLFDHQTQSCWRSQGQQDTLIRTANETPGTLYNSMTSAHLDIETQTCTWLVGTTTKSWQNKHNLNARPNYFARTSRFPCIHP